MEIAHNNGKLYLGGWIGVNAYCIREPLFHGCMRRGVNKFIIRMVYTMDAPQK